MYRIRNGYQEWFRHMMPALAVLIIVAITIVTAVGQAANYDGGNYVVAETDQVIVKGEKENDFQKNDPLTIGNIDLSKCADGTYTGRGQGYAGYLEVDVTIKDHKMTKIILTANQADDIPYLNRAKNVISAVLQGQTLDVDTISGATYSSNGILSAIEDALKQAMGEESQYEENEGKSDQSSLNDVDFEDGDYNDGTYTGSAKAYNGNIDVAVIIAKGKISKIAITKTQDDEEYLTMAKTVISKIIKKQTPNVDTVSGATYSSRGIINATKQALKKALKSLDQGNGADFEEEDNTNSEPEITDDEDDWDMPALEISYINGSYSGSAWGYSPRSEIYLMVDVTDNKISGITVTDHREDEEFFDPVIKYLIPRIIKRQSTDGVDVIAGATFSSQGLKDAVDNALKDAKLE